MRHADDLLRPDCLAEQVATLKATTSSHSCSLAGFVDVTGARSFVWADHVGPMDLDMWIRVLLVLTGAGASGESPGRYSSLNASIRRAIWGTREPQYLAYRWVRLDQWAVLNMG